MKLYVVSLLLILSCLQSAFAAAEASWVTYINAARRAEVQHNLPLRDRYFLGALSELDQVLPSRRQPLSEAARSATHEVVSQAFVMISRKLPVEAGNQEIMMKENYEFQHHQTMATTKAEADANLVALHKFIGKQHEKLNVGLKAKVDFWRRLSAIFLRGWTQVRPDLNSINTELSRAQRNLELNEEKSNRQFLAG